MLERICKNPEMFEMLVDHLTTTRHSREAVAILGCRNHPQITKLAQDRTTQTTKWHTSLAKVVYREESEAMFRDMRVHGAAHVRLQGREKRKAAKFCGDKISLSQETLMAAAMVDHVREVVSLGSLISVPAMGSGLNLLWDSLGRNKAVMQTAAWDTWAHKLMSNH